MTNPDQQQQSRREMLRSGVRYLALAGVSLLSAGLLVRGRGGSASDRCPRSAPCRHCGALAKCRRPQALAAKNAKSEVIPNGE